MTEYIFSRNASLDINKPQVNGKGAGKSKNTKVVCSFTVDYFLPVKKKLIRGQEEECTDIAAFFSPEQRIDQVYYSADFKMFYAFESIVVPADNLLWEEWGNKDSSSN